MHFFERQKVDLIGQVGVSLQKILLLFMVLSAFTLFNGGLLSFLICLVGFIGAVKRNPRLLATYYSVTIFFIMLFFFLSLASMATYNNVEYSDEYMSSESYSYSSSSASASAAASASASASTSSSDSKPASHFTAPAHPRNIWRGVMRAAGAAPEFNHGPANTTSSESSFSYESSDYYYEDDVEWNSINIFIAVVAIFFYFFMSYLKIKSLVLAYRMRKLILLASILPEFFHDDSESPKQESEPTPAPVQPVSNKCVVDDDEEDTTPAPQQTYFAQPGYMPYAPVPMQYPGAPSMVPPPMMYGQYPVYYSFAPATPDQSQDKL